MQLFSLSGKLLVNAAPYLAAMDAASKATDAVAGGIADVIKDSTVLAARFQTTANALAVFTGSASSARRELASLDELARKTVGLRLESSEKGYQQLRALGFEATRAKGLIKELGEEKILSGADDDALKRVFFNFTQIASGGQKVSQEIRELLTAMPSLKRVFIDAFGSLDPKKIQSFVESNPDQFFDKLIASMAKGKTAAGGFENSVGKLDDAWTEAKRAFGEPLLPELTKDLDSFTNYLQGNKNTWREWGDYAVDVIQGVKNAAKEASEFKGVQQGGDVAGFILKNMSVVGAIKNIADGFSQSGAQTRKENDNKKPQKSWRGFGKLLEDNKGELAAERIAAEEKRIRDEEIARGKEIQNLTTWKNAKDSIYDSFYSTQEAKLSSYLTNSFAEEKNQLNDLAGLRNQKFNSDLVRTQNYYNRLVTLANGDKEEIRKLQSEKTEAVTKINADYEKDVFATQRKLAEIERDSYNDRLKEAANFKRQIVDELSFKLDVNQFNFGESLKNSPFLQRDNFDEMIRLTNQSFNEVLRITKDSYAYQINEIGISEERKTNIRREAAFAEKKLAEQNRRDILRIEEEKKNRIAQFYSDIYGAAADAEQQKFQRKSTFLESVFGINNLNTSELDKTFKFIEQRTGELSELQKKFNQQSNDFNDLSVKIYKAPISTDGERKELDLLRGSLESLRGERTLTFSELSYLKDVGSDFYQDFGSFRKLLTENLGDETVFDQIGAKMLEMEKSSRIDSLNSKIFAAQQRLNAPNGQQDAKAALDLQSLLSEKATITAEYFRKEQEQRANSITGMREYIALVKDGDPVTLAAIQHARLTDTLKLETEAYTKLSQQMVYSSEEVKARVADFLGSQPSLTDIVGDLQIDAMQSAFDMVDSGFNKIAESIGIADTAGGKFVTNLLASLTKLWANQVFQNLFKVGGEASQGSSGGSIWSKIFGFAIKAAGAAVGGTAGGSASTGAASNTFGGGSSFGSTLSAVGGGGKFFKFADGGHIRGEGTKTSDSIPMWASNGEFMQNAKAVDYYGVDFMNAINNRDIPKDFFSASGFADGGLVSSVPVITPNYSTVNNAGNKSVNNHYNIEIKTGGGQSANSGGNFPKPSTNQLRKAVMDGIMDANSRK